MLKNKKTQTKTKPPKKPPKNQTPENYEISFSDLFPMA